MYKKRYLRILIATHAPLLPEFGAAQMAINLGNALRILGHDVSFWSPHPIPKSIRSWNRYFYMKKGLRTFLQTQPNFDLIDCPSFMISSQIKNKSLIICRNVQPELLYILSHFNTEHSMSLKDTLKLPLDWFNAILHAISVIYGWSISDHLFCLGSYEYRWMNKWFPCWKNKLVVYYNAISKSDQDKLASIRTNRLRTKDISIKFLWIGRWVPHKGIKELTYFINYWHKIRPHDNFTLAGCGDNFKSKMLQKLSKCSYVKVIPYFAREEVFDLLANHHIGLFTSRVEGWGLSLNEMLESGMPVFATTAGGVEDLKSLLGDRLKSFPPTIESATSNLNLTPWPKELYQQLFTWDSIAKAYLQKIFAD